MVQEVAKLFTRLPPVQGALCKYGYGAIQLSKKTLKACYLDVSGKRSHAYSSSTAIKVCVPFLERALLS